MFNFIQNGKFGMVTYKNQVLLDEISLVVAFRRGAPKEYFVQKICQENDETVFTFETDSRLLSLSLKLKQKENAAVFSVFAECSDSFGYDDFTFSGENSIVLKYNVRIPKDAVLSSSLRDSPFWQMPSFDTDLKKLNPATQSVLIKSGENHVHIMPVISDLYRANLSGTGLILSAGYSRLTKIYGEILALAVSDSPYKAIESNFKLGKEMNAIRVPLINEREYPEIFNYFGFCTWDAFYNDVSSEKLFLKLDEFKEKNIPVKWVIIDDGWSPSNSGKLLSFEEDRNKFPEGFKKVIERMKSEYGIEKVGVWHAFCAYWSGIEKNSELYEVQKENLFETPTGWILPSLDSDKAFKFWDSWHSYLREQGVDFVKVDFQSGVSPKYDEIVPCVQGVRILHESLEKSVFKNFGGIMINCMGMDFENILNRPLSAINRNSNDFFPKNESSIKNHIIQNVYFSPIHSQIHYCDFDMWWSGQKSSEQSAVLRAISGGPIYVSDALGETVKAAIMPAINENGKIFRCRHAAMPTLDCIYDDCILQKKALKVFNGFEENFVAAAFCLNAEGCTGEIRIDDLPGALGEYVAQNYFTKELHSFNKENPINFTLNENQTGLWNIYRVKDGEIHIGRQDKYIGITESVDVIAI